MNKSGLLVRLAVVIAFSSLAVGFISAQLFYRLTYLNEVEIANKEITQLYQTVSATASIAAYLADHELANEVVNGLDTNDIVLAASVRSNEELITPVIQASGSPLDFKLHSPFEPDKVVGILSILPNLTYIEQRAQKIGQDNSMALIAQAFVVTMIAIYITYVLITRPMISSARRLHIISPGTSDRLQVPDFHDGSELGELVRDINKLLDKTENQISEERKLRNDIEVLEKRFRMLFENSVSPIVLMEPRGSILLYNQAFQLMLDKVGFHFKKNYGPLLAELFQTPERLQKTVQNSFTNDEIATGEYQLKTNATKASFWVQVVVTSIVSDDMKEYYQITLHDISKRKKELEQLSLQADYDQLTQLLNRNGLEKQLHTLIESKTPFVILLMDLNGFKQVNDVYGHNVGDEILIHLAGVLKKGLRREDLTCRWGGDEFVLVLKQINKAEVLKIVGKLIAKINKPYYLANVDKSVTVGASIGAAFYPDNEQNIHALIQKADQAMYVVKRRDGRCPPQHFQFSDEMPSEEQG